MATSPNSLYMNKRTDKRFIEERVVLAMLKKACGWEALAFMAPTKGIFERVYCCSPHVHSPAAQIMD